MKQLFFLLFAFISMNVMAQTNELKKQTMTHLIDNNRDKLFTTIYPNPNKETIILLHGGPGFPSDLKEVVEILKDSFQVIYDTPQK